LASDGDVKQISDFFSIIRTKVHRIPFAQEDFLAFVSSLFEGLIQVSDVACLRESFSLAKELIELCVIPSDRTLLSFEEEEKLFCQEVVYYEGKSAREGCSFLHRALCGKGLWEMPLYMYEGVGRLLLRFCESDCMVCELAMSFPQIQHFSFEVKLCFMKPIAYKLLFLHRAFRMGLYNFRILKVIPEDEWRIVEELNGDFRDLKVSIDELVIMGIFELPSNYENVVNWSGAFKLWIQGDDISKLVNEDTESTLNGEQMVVHNENDPVNSGQREESFDKENDSGIPLKLKGSSGNRNDPNLVIKPETPEMAKRCFERYKFGMNLSVCVQYGILALEYYLNNITSFEREAREVLGTLIEVIHNLPPGSDLMAYFSDRINWKAGWFSWDNAIQVIIGNAKKRKTKSKRDSW
jgi:hypothetical protein